MMSNELRRNMEEKKYTENELQTILTGRELGELQTKMNTLLPIPEQIKDLKEFFKDTYLTRREYLDDKKAIEEARINRQKPISELLWGIVKNISNFVALALLLAILARGPEILKLLTEK